MENKEREELKIEILDLEEQLKELKNNLCFPESIFGLDADGNEIDICDCDSCAKYLYVESKIYELDKKLNERRVI